MRHNTCIKVKKMVFIKRKNSAGLYTTLPDMAARSSAIPLGYWIGHLVLLVGSVLACCIGAISGLQAADGVCFRVNSSLGMYLYMVAVIALIFVFISAR